MKIGEVERLRGVAALLVFAHHLPMFQACFPSKFFNGSSGVDLFFVISGFVVTLSLRRLIATIDRVGDLMKVFYIRRVFRILPLAVFTAAIWFVASLFSVAYDTTNHILRAIAAFVLLHHNYMVVYQSLDVLGWYWSLAVEEHFYLFLPTFLVVIHSKRFRFAGALAGIFLLSAIVRPLSLRWGFTLNEVRYLTHFRFDGLLVGVVLGLLHVNPVPGVAAPARRIAAQILSIVALGILSHFVFVLAFFGWSYQGAGFTITWMCGALLVYLASKGRGYVLEFPVVSRVLEWTGSRSYAIYMMHIFVITSFKVVQSHWAGFGGPYGRSILFNRYSALLICVVATLVIADLVYRLIEKPFLERGMRYAATFLRPRSATPDAGPEKSDFRLRNTG